MRIFLFVLNIYMTTNVLAKAKLWYTSMPMPPLSERDLNWLSSDLLRGFHKNNQKRLALIYLISLR